MMTLSVSSGTWSDVITAARCKWEDDTGQETNVPYMDAMLRVALRELDIEISIPELGFDKHEPGEIVIEPGGH